MNRRDLEHLIRDGSIGEGSLFHATFGYYAQGVDENTATLPSGWRDRLVAIKNANTRGATGWCLEAHDLILSKYVAGREKDAVYVRAALAAGLVSTEGLHERLVGLPVDPLRLHQISAQIVADAKLRP